MKKLALIIGFLVFSFANIHLVYSATQYYTFEGYIDDYNFQDDSGLFTKYGVDIGDPVSYVVEIDFDLPPQVIRIDGSEADFYEEFPYMTGDNFYAKVVYSTPYIPDPGTVYEYETDQNYPAFTYGGVNSGNYGIINCGSNYYNLDIRSSSKDVIDWTVGGANGVILGSFAVAVGEIGTGADYSWYYTEPLTLTDISSSSVPIPGALWLLGSGLVGLVCLKKRHVS